MKKIIMLTAITSTTLLFSEVYYKNKEERYTNKINEYSNNFKKNEPIKIKGEVLSISDNGNTLTIIVRNNTKENIRIETRKTNINIEDKINGSCSTYEASRWKNCSIHVSTKNTHTPNNFKDINGKIKYISILNDYNVLEVENYYETLYIRVNKNTNFKKNEKIYGGCNNIIRGEYTNCSLVKRY